MELLKEELERLYLKDYLTDQQIGEIYGLSQSQVCIIRNDFGIPTFCPRERERILRGGGQEISQRQMEIVFGTLLGDGSLKGKGKNGRNLSISHGEKQKEYLYWLYDELKSICVSEPSIYIAKEKYPTYSLLTECRKEFLEIKEQIYIPQKTVNSWWLSKLTPLSIAIWFMDDGNCAYLNKNKRAFSFATNSFSDEENYLLKDFFASSFSINAVVKHIQRGKSIQYNLFIYEDSEEKFIDLISSFIPTCMKYKLPSQEQQKTFISNIKNSITKEQLQKLYLQEHKTQLEIANELHVSRGLIRKYMDLYNISKRDASSAQLNGKKNSNRDDCGRFTQLEFTKENDEIAHQLFIEMRKDDFPYYPINDLSVYCSAIERIILKQNDSYCYSNVGMKLIRDFCPQIFRMAHKGSLTPLQIFEDDDKLLDCIKRTIKYANKKTISAVRHGLKTYRKNRCVSNFPPVWAKWILEEIQEKDLTLLDFSCGFGGRLIGSYCSKLVKLYIGVDPLLENINSNEKINEILQYHGKLNKFNFDSEFHNITAEEYFSNFNDKVDLVLTSPPYFDTEIYSNESDQCYIKYNNYDSWKKNWLSFVLESSFNSLYDDGLCVIFITNNSQHNMADDTKKIMHEIFGNIEVKQFLLPNVEYNRNKDLKRYDYALISKK